MNNSDQTGMTFEEYQSHFSLWALVKSPLLIGCDVTNMTQETFDILTAREVIAVNQDPLGAQGRRIRTADKNGVELWSVDLSQGRKSVILFNRGEISATGSFLWEEIGLNPDVLAEVRNLWESKSLGIYSGKFKARVAPHGVVMVNIIPQSKN